MPKSSDLYMWGERGLIATFFVDLHSTQNPEAFGMFLQAIEIQAAHFPRRTNRVLTIIEPDFANRGFGHPDAIVLLQTEKETFVIILEAKRVPYVRAAKPSSLRGVHRSGYNSSLNGQLELDFALALALERFQNNHAELAEPEWISATPYATERGKLGTRRLKNPVVLREVVARIGPLPLQNYFFVVLTTDPSNPFRDKTSAAFYPELYHPTYGMQNCWSHMQDQFGWLNYLALENVIRDLMTRNILKSASLFVASLQMNRDNMDLRPVGTRGLLTAQGQATTRAGWRGTSMIYAPRINPTTFLHFSWRGEGCALRDFSQSTSTPPIPNREYKTSEVRALIDREISIGREKPIEDTSYWHERIATLNRSLLSR